MNFIRPALRGWVRGKRLFMKKYLYNLATDKTEGMIALLCKFFLFLFSLIYCLIVKGLVFFYRLKPYRLNCKVISVGNITFGGTGKTPLVEYIARYLKEQGRKVAIISRGYKRRREHEGRGTRDDKNYEIIGDEPYMLQKKLLGVPVVVNADRIFAGRRAIDDYGVDTLIFDDGFQQWKIKKDLEIVTLDAMNPFGNGSVLPRGILREPLSSLKRADVFVITKTNFNPDVKKIEVFLSKINPSALILKSGYQLAGFYGLGRDTEMADIEILKSNPVVLLSGIASPDSFEQLIINSGIKVGLSFKFPDHHNYSQEEIKGIIHSSLEKKINIIITTEKDAVRLLEFPLINTGVAVIVLRIRLEIIENEEKFNNRLLRLFTL